MIRWFPLIGLLFTTAAFAADPELWAGVRVDDPGALGLSKIVPLVGSDAWQGSFADQSGFVRVWVSPDAASAQALFEFQRAASATVPMPDIAHPGWDQTAGDGASIAIARIGNVVFLARDHANHANARIESVASGLVHVAPIVPKVLDRGGVVRDGVGRQIR